MAHSTEIILFTYFFLELFEILRIKLNDPVASGAYHMVMMAVAERMLVNIAFICPCHLFDQPALNKQV